MSPPAALTVTVSASPCPAIRNSLRMPSAGGRLFESSPLLCNLDRCDVTTPLAPRLRTGKDRKAVGGLGWPNLLHQRGKV